LLALAELLGMGWQIRLPVNACDISDLSLDTAAFTLLRLFTASIAPDHLPQDVSLFVLHI